MSSRATPLPRYALALATAATLLAACSGLTDPFGTDPPFDESSFEGLVAGGLAHTMSGQATFATVSDGEVGFALYLGALDDPGREGTGYVLFARGKADIPAPGTYAIYDLDSPDPVPPDAFVLTASLVDGAGVQYGCFGASGTLTVDAASGDRMRGGYTAQARCVRPSGGEDVAVTLTGTFEAVGGRYRVPTYVGGEPAGGAGRRAPAPPDTPLAAPPVGPAGRCCSR